MKELKIKQGYCYPLGSTFDGKGVNFSIFSANAEKVVLCLFDDKGKKELRRIEILENDHGIWHVYVEGIGVGQIYGYRVYGPYKPTEGKRFNENKLLVDPYAKKLVGDLVWHKAIFGYDTDSPAQDLSFSKLDSAPYVPKSVVVKDNFDWSGDVKPNIPFEKTLIYELHTKGYTALFPKVGDNKRGKFEALSSKSVQTYLKWLGVSAVELLPVHAFFPYQAPKERVNYWGYETLSFFALENAYLKNGDANVFKNMVKTFHQNGLEVILDVVYNHTIEGNHLGPTLCYRGIDNETYYTLDKTNKRFYFDSTGCGAAFNVQNVNVLTLIMDSLRYFVSAMHVDGFRFDLAAALGREKGSFKYNSAFLQAIRQDEVLRSVKLIAEPWDVGANGYQIGAFPPGVAEWNDRFRDVVRRFWRGDDRQIGELASRLSGSSDIFGYNNRNIWSSVNFITAHDGFCLRDLVSFEKKHNEANGENNKDGTDDNFSSNSGDEGLLVSEEVKAQRFRRAKNLMATLLLSFGTPMILEGDEFLNTRFGSNNPYAQDNILTHIAWDAIEKQGYDFIRFCRAGIKLRKSLKVFERKHFFTGKQEKNAPYKDLAWFTEKGHEFTAADWQNNARKSLSYLAYAGDDLLYVILNASKEDIVWKLPSLKKTKLWSVVLCTSDQAIEQKIGSGKTINVPAQSVTAIQITV